jgi:hypothetical protein
LRFELPSDGRKQFRREAMIGVRDSDIPFLELFEAVKVAWGGEEPLPDELKEAIIDGLPNS